MKLKPLKLNTLHLKIIATFFMLIDHIACCLIPNSLPIYWIMRIAGRISAPLFWFCFVEGYKKTSNRFQYSKRLFFATIVMVIGNLTLSILLGDKLSFGVNALQPNIFLTMFLMILAIECIKRVSTSRKIITKIIYGFLTTLVCLSVGCGAEFGWFALFSILSLYYIESKSAKCIMFVFVSIVTSALTQGFVQIFMIISAIFMAMYDDTKPKHNLKYFFYIFYPVHLWILILISTLI